jgi:hypothetical protein
MCRIRCDEPELKISAERRIGARSPWAVSITVTGPPGLGGSFSSARAYLGAYGQHGGDQIQQWAAEVVLGHQHLPVAIQTEMVDGCAGNRPVWGRNGQGAAGEVLPSGSVAATGGVHHATLHGAVLLDPGRNDPHQFILRLASAADGGQTW